MAIKVSQAVIDEIKKKGMSASIKEANSGSSSAEFLEGAKRMYGNRVTGSGSGPKAGDVRKVDTGHSPKAGDVRATDSEKKPVTMPKSAPASASRKVGKTTAEKALGTKNAETARKVTTPVSKVLTSVGQKTKSTGKVDLGGVGKKLGLNNPFKPRKRK